MSVEISRGLDIARLTQRLAVVAALGLGGNAVMTKEATGAASCPATRQEVIMTLLELTHGKARRDFGDKCLQRVETKGTKSGQCVAAYDFQGKPMLDSECKNLARESFPEADTVEKILDVDGVPLIEEFSIPLENKVSRFGNRSGDQILAAFNRK